MKRTEITEIKVYWDLNSVPQGWAYSVVGQRGLIDSGPVDDLDEDADGTELQEAVSEIARANDIDDGDVATEPHVDGGYAVWTR